MNFARRVACNGRLLVSVLPALALLWPHIPAARAAEEGAADGRATFEMKEVSIFDAGEAAKGRFGGHFVYCSTTPDAKVTVYPQLKSKRPLYGTLAIDANRFLGERGTEYHFVLDASGEPNKGPPQSPPSDPAAAAKAKESEPTENYDLLYFDANRDLDLTNDPVVRLMKKPLPPALAAEAGMPEPVVFDSLSFSVDFGPDVGVRPLRVVPLLEEVTADKRATGLRPHHFALRHDPFGKHGVHRPVVAGMRAGAHGRFDQLMTGLFLQPTESGFDWFRRSSWFVELVRHARPRRPDLRLLRHSHRR